MNIIYLFEDTEGQRIPRFYRLGISNSTNDRIRYSGGAGNLCYASEDILQDKNVELLCTFVDLVPNNINTAVTFSNLCEFACLPKHLGRMFVIPTLGLEYYFIKSINDRRLADNQEIVDTFLSLNPYADTEWNKKFKMSSRKKYRTFEKFGKLLIDNNFGRCIQGISMDYTTHDCICARPRKQCSKVATAQEKAIEMLETYDIVPNGSLINNKTSIGLSGAADLIEKYLVTIREKAEIQPEIIESYETNIETFDYAISKFSELRRLMKC